MYSEAALKDYVKAARQRLDIQPGFSDKLVGKAITKAGSLASGAVGAVGQALGIKGQPVPGTKAVQSGIEKTSGAIGKVFQTSADIEKGAADIAKQRQISSQYGDSGYTTVPSALIGGKQYKINDVIKFRDNKGRAMQGLYAGEYVNKQGQKVANILDPKYA